MAGWNAVSAGRGTASIPEPHGRAADAGGGFEQGVFLPRAQSQSGQFGRGRWDLHDDHRADAQGGRSDRRHHRLSDRSARIQRQADCARDELRRPSRDRHREYAAAFRITRVAGTADGDFRSSTDHFQFARRTGASVRCCSGKRRTLVRRQFRNLFYSMARHFTLPHCIALRRAMPKHGVRRYR